MSFVPRDWQVKAWERCKPLPKSVVEACPGSGKSAFSGGLAKYWLDEGHCHHVIAVVPSINIKRGVMTQWDRNWGMKVRGSLALRSSSAFRIPTEFDATVITYQELRNEQCADALRLWKSNGWEFGVVFDEIHHAANDQTWGDTVSVIGRELASRVLLMTGTPFRTDGKIIEMMNYVFLDGEHVANPDYRYVYREAVNDDVCRPIACRWIEGEISFAHATRGQYTRSVDKVQEWELGEATKRFFDPNGEVMGNLVRRVHEDMMVLRESPKYADAGALFVCQPGNRGGENEERHVKKMAALIRRVTGFEPVVVTHDDPDSADRIDAFRRSTDPYIVAINMVSEGVDITRLRKVAFCRYTDSEMIFRQIVGRVLRKTIDNDPVASAAYVPRFPKMAEIAERLWEEAKAGVREGRYVNCLPPKTPTDDPPRPSSPKLIGIDAHGDAGSGNFDGTDVTRNFIALAEQVKRTHTSYKPLEPVHFGNALQAAFELNGVMNATVDEQQRRGNLIDRLTRRVNMLARFAHKGNYGKAWSTELFVPYQVASLDDIRTLWTHDRIEKAIDHLDRRIGEAAFNREGTNG